METTNQSCETEKLIIGKFMFSLQKEAYLLALQYFENTYEYFYRQPDKDRLVECVKLKFANLLEQYAAYEEYVFLKSDIEHIIQQMTVDQDAPKSSVDSEQVAQTSLTPNDSLKKEERANVQNSYCDEEPENVSFWKSNTAKFLMVVVLSLLLLIPLSYVKDLISERSYRAETFETEVGGQYGGDIYFYGPVLEIPYLIPNSDVSHVVNKEKAYVQKNGSMKQSFLYIFPDQLNNRTFVKTRKLNRSNYEAAVFSADMKFDGKYSASEFDKSGIDKRYIQWNKARVIIKSNSLKGIRDNVAMTFNGHKCGFEPLYGANSNEAETLESEPIILNPDDLKDKLGFDLHILFSGSKEIQIVPIGKTTNVSMSSNWASPGFTGYFLPNNDDSKNISADGFSANWKILQMNRPFGQQMNGSLPDLSKYAFGVKFVIPVNEYSKNDRAGKYGFLIIGLTLLIFFLMQTISKINIHIFQYSMIGVALVLFYTLLVAITEHSNFLIAYIISAVAIIAMIALYSLSVLKIRKFSLFIAIALTLLYGFIFAIIQMENYALLAGSIGLFIILALVMYFSRKIDWKNQRI